MSRLPAIVFRCSPPAVRLAALLRLGAVAACLAAVLGIAGCGTLGSFLPSIPRPSFGWFGHSKKPGPLPDIQALVTPQLVWQAQVGNAAPGLAPGVTTDAVYAAASDGTLTKLDLRSGRSLWRVNTGRRLSAGAGADATLVAVGTAKGEVLAFDSDGKPVWEARVGSEVMAPPLVSDGVVAVWSGDGRVYGLAAADGKTTWVYQHVNPPLTVRNTAGGSLSRGGLFTGTPGGKLVALDMATGSLGWESSVATPKGATELERIADVTSLPVVLEQQACAVAFQGRIACFDLTRGVLEWSRDISSLAGIVADNRYLYVTDDRGSIHALDKTTGASIWKQDKLAKRQPGGPQLVGNYLGVVDAEGYLHLLDRSEGTLAGRLATDGSPATAQPAHSADMAIWQSEGGTLYSVTAR